MMEVRVSHNDYTEELEDHLRHRLGQYGSEVKITHDDHGKIVIDFEEDGPDHLTLAEVGDIVEAITEDFEWVSSCEVVP